MKFQNRKKCLGSTFQILISVVWGLISIIFLSYFVREEGWRGKTLYSKEFFNMTFCGFLEHFYSLNLTLTLFFFTTFSKIVFLFCFVFSFWNIILREKMAFWKVFFNRKIPFYMFKCVVKLLFLEVKKLPSPFEKRNFALARGPCWIQIATIAL